MSGESPDSHTIALLGLTRDVLRKSLGQAFTWEPHDRLIVEMLRDTSTPDSSIHQWDGMGLRIVEITGMRALCIQYCEGLAVGILTQSGMVGG